MNKETDCNADENKKITALLLVFTFLLLSKVEINDTLINDSAVNKVIRNANYKLTYYDCAAELFYNPKTNHIVTLNQYMSAKIYILPDTKVGLSSVVGWATQKNTLNIWDFKD